jgi:hypothetical protein
MSHENIIDAEGLKHWNFIRNAEESLKRLHEIESEFTWEERKILDQTCNIITEMLNKKYSMQEARLERLMNSRDSSEDP